MRPLYIFILFGLVLSILFSSGQIENPDTHLRLTQTRILLQDGALGLAEDVGEDMHGNIAINESGHRHMVYSPGQSLVFIPIYYISNFFCSDEVNSYYFSAFYVSFINYFIHAFCAFFLFKISTVLGASERRAYLLSGFFGLTSYSFVFAQSTYEHHFEMLFILMSMFYTLKKDFKNREVFVGLLLSLGLLFRTTTILAVPAILLMQKDNKSRFKVLLSLSIGISFVLLYNYYRFGNPLESGYSLAWSLAHDDQFDFWSISRMPVALFGFLFSPGKGLVFFSSTILIALLGIKTFWQKHRMMSISIFLITATYLGIFSMNFAWHGSIWSYGPRYILPIVPFLYLPIMCIKPKKWLFFVLMIAFSFQVVLISVNYKRDVLEDFIANDGLSDLDYLYSWDKEPHFAQAKQLVKILPKNLSPLNNYQPNSAWKKEIRTASSADVINFSIEKNAINFWWVRVFHWRLSVYSRTLSILMLVFGLTGFFILIQYVKGKFI
ncbi:hypothetical protein N8Z19_00010 [Saprospiraceae bacterium]|nr:hypothetical protein [Saprospiraceae bacterium]